MTSTLTTQEMMVQYHFLQLRTISDRTDPEPPQMDPDEDNISQGVTLYPPTGATITVLSNWGPVKVIVAIGVDAPSIVSAPDLAHLDKSWDGTITLHDSSFDLHTFDDALIDQVLDSAGRHHVKIDWRYDHSRPITDEFDSTPYQEYVIVRFA